MPVIQVPCMFSGDLDFWPFALDCKPCYLNVVLFWALPQGTFIFSITTTFSFSLPVWWDGNGSSFPKGGCLHGECLLLWYILEQLFRVLFSLVFVLCYLLPYKKKKRVCFSLKKQNTKCQTISLLTNSSLEYWYVPDVFWVKWLTWLLWCAGSQLCHWKLGFVMFYSQENHV